MRTYIYVLPVTCPKPRLDLTFTEDETERVPPWLLNSDSRKSLLDFLKIPLFTPVRVKSVTTMNREREKEETVNPGKRQRRMEDDDCKKINFFQGTRVSPLVSPEEEFRSVVDRGDSRYHSRGVSVSGLRESRPDD